VTVTAIARDAAGNEGTASATTTVSVQPDSEPPQVTLQAPAETAPGATLRVSARADDAVGVARVVFLLGTSEIGTDTEAPYEATTTVAPGTGNALSHGSRLRRCRNMGEATGNVCRFQRDDRSGRHARCPHQRRRRGALDVSA
jgi:hypothetical protein